MVNEKLIKGGQGRTAESLETDCANVAALFFIAVTIFILEIAL